VKSRESQMIVENINSALRSRKMTKNELIKLSGLPASTISRILSGERNFTIDKMIPIARALNIDINEFFSGVQTKDVSKQKSTQINDKQYLSAGILSIDRKRFACIKDANKKVVATSVLTGDLDLAEPIANLLAQIEDSICAALLNSPVEKYQKMSESEIRQGEFLETINLNLVTQSYEFLEKRKNFIYKASQLYNSVIHLPDWQITYLSDFKNTQGIALIVDKGVSLSFMHQGKLQKLGGWKFPAYDLGGENWLGNQAVQHTIEAAEGICESTKLSSTILAKYNNELYKLVETCFHGANTDVFCQFCETLSLCYFQKDRKAQEIITTGFNEIMRLVNAAKNILQTRLDISISGSLSNIYQHHFDKKHVAESASYQDKTSLLASIDKVYLTSNGVQYIE
jgi:N-acetylglucosamine kinase-like BadF-type ATPase/plasmid maintenance system antidote protein VapI